MSDRVSEIIFLEAKADEVQIEIDQYRWEAARLICEELRTGKSQQVLADEIGKSANHVSVMKRVHDQKSAFDHENYTFTEAYRLVQTPKHTKDPKQIIQDLLDNPEILDEIAGSRLVRQAIKEHDAIEKEMAEQQFKDEFFEDNEALDGSLGQPFGLHDDLSEIDHRLDIIEQHVTDRQVAWKEDLRKAFQVKLRKSMLRGIAITDLMENPEELHITDEDTSWLSERI